VKDVSQSDHESEFSRLIAVYGAAVRRLCASYVREPSDREDLFQDIAVALWTALPRFRGDASERTWLYRIAHNVALTSVAKRRRQQRSEQPSDKLIGDPSSQIDHRRIALLESIHQLGPVDRQLVQLYLEGLSAREIEDVTGLTANNVGVRLTRLRHKLRSALRAKEVRQ
jgi:RNA polymerase sigma-70 factor, ECF subfamily